MSKKILVAFGSKYGATAEIAKKIREILSNSGAAVKVLSADKIVDVEKYDVVVVGSGVYMGMWRKEAQKFLQKNLESLAQKKVWVFVSGLTGDGDPVEEMQGKLYPEKLQPVFEAIKPVETTAFHGNVNFTKLSGFEKWIMKKVKAPEGDFRDWDAISAWAKGISSQL